MHRHRITSANRLGYSNGPFNGETGLLDLARHRHMVWDSGHQLRWLADHVRLHHVVSIPLYLPTTNHSDGPQTAVWALYCIAALLDLLDFDGVLRSCIAHARMEPLDLGAGRIGSPTRVLSVFVSNPVELAL